MIPILYSFRRCPYAIRARMAIKYSGIQVELREVKLKDMPPQMLEISAKATVPVLLLPDGKVFDESMDIMYWALEKNDPKNWLDTEVQNTAETLIYENDFEFKKYLDFYKYADRYPQQTARHYRSQCEAFLQQLENKLTEFKYLVTNNISIADIAIFPFIRQFANVDKQWFTSSSYQKLKQWLETNIHSENFSSVMHKYETWKANDKEIFF